MSQLRQAVQLYQSFREQKPRHKLARVRVPLPKIAVCMGYADAIDYSTTHRGKRQPYRHRFAQGSRPLLCVSPNGQQLLLLGGLYKWDRRGIVDHDKHGREIIPKSHARNPAMERGIARGEIVAYRGFTLKQTASGWDVYRHGQRITSGSTLALAKQILNFLYPPGSSRPKAPLKRVT